MLIEAIVDYLAAIGGPDRAAWKLWLGVTSVAVIACVLLVVL